MALLRALRDRLDSIGVLLYHQNPIKPLGVNTHLDQSFNGSVRRHPALKLRGRQVVG